MVKKGSFKFSSSPHELRGWKEDMKSQLEKVTLTGFYECCSEFSGSPESNMKIKAKGSSSWEHEELAGHCVCLSFFSLVPQSSMRHNNKFLIIHGKLNYLLAIMTVKTMSLLYLNKYENGDTANILWVRKEEKRQLFTNSLQFL
jgi:hypothetical protein